MSPDLQVMIKQDCSFRQCMHMHIDQTCMHVHVILPCAFLHASCLVPSSCLMHLEAPTCSFKPHPCSTPPKKGSKRKEPSEASETEGNHSAPSLAGISAVSGLDSTPMSTSGIGGSSGVRGPRAAAGSASGAGRPGGAAGSARPGGTLCGVKQRCRHSDSWAEAKPRGMGRHGPGKYMKQVGMLIGGGAKMIGDKRIQKI